MSVNYQLPFDWSKVTFGQAWERQKKRSIQKWKKRCLRAFEIFILLSMIGQALDSGAESAKKPQTHSYGASIC